MARPLRIEYPVCRRSLSFEKKFGSTRKLLIGGDGISFDEFLSRPAED